MTSRYKPGPFDTRSTLFRGTQDASWLLRERLRLEYPREEKTSIYYEGADIDTRRVDFIVEGCIVEIKAKREFDRADVGVLGAVGIVPEPYWIAQLVEELVGWVCH
jgi:hypothetical protein